MFPRIRVGPRAQHRILSQFSTLEEINPLQTTLYEWGIVSMRVGFVLRSAEIKPLFFDLFRSNKFLISGSYTFVCLLDPSARAFLLPPPHLTTAPRRACISDTPGNLVTFLWTSDERQGLPFIIASLAPLLPLLLYISLIQEEHQNSDQFLLPYILLRT